MIHELTDYGQQTCQWCGGAISVDGTACSACGAVSPRIDVAAPGLNRVDDLPDFEPSNFDPEVLDDEQRAKQILKELDAYIPENEAPPITGRSDPTDDAIVIVGLLAIAATIGGLMGWFLAPSLIHDFFQTVLSVESDGPEAFRRLGGFIGALASIFIGAFVATLIRR
jgi:hypothetical protein